MKTVYLTGGTGFLGSHFIRNHLLGGPFDVQCFVRGATPEACALRLHETLGAVDASYPDRRLRGLDALTAVPSDITLPAFGLGEAFFTARAGRADATFFHFASSLQYQEKDRQVIHAHNIGGMRHAVDVAAALGCGVFYYVSTAFTVGVHEGRVPEALHRNARFNNYYEETKCEAEHLITAIVARAEMQFDLSGEDVRCDFMDITACHANGCRLHLKAFLELRPQDFAHDFAGIQRHINRRTGKLEDCFTPRCAVQ